MQRRRDRSLQNEIVLAVFSVSAAIDAIAIRDAGAVASQTSAHAFDYRPTTTVKRSNEAEKDCPRSAIFVQRFPYVPANGQSLKGHNHAETSAQFCFASVAHYSWHRDRANSSWHSPSTRSMRAVRRVDHLD